MIKNEHPAHLQRPLMLSVRSEMLGYLCALLMELFGGERDVF